MARRKDAPVWLSKGEYEASPATKKRAKANLEIARARRRAILERTRAGLADFDRRAAGADMSDLDHLPVITNRPARTAGLHTKGKPAAARAAAKAAELAVVSAMEIVASSRPGPTIIPGDQEEVSPLTDEEIDSLIEETSQKRWRAPASTSAPIAPPVARERRRYTCSTCGGAGHRKDSPRCPRAIPPAITNEAPGAPAL